MSIIRQVKSSNLKLISWKKIKRHVKGKLTSAFGRAIQSSNSDGPACYPGEKHHKLKLTEGEDMKKKKQTTEKSQTNQQILIESQIKMKVHWGKKWIGQPNEYPPCPTKEKDHNAPQNPSNRWGYWATMTVNLASMSWTTHPHTPRAHTPKSLDSSTSGDTIKSGVMCVCCVCAVCVKRTMQAQNK